MARSPTVHANAKPQFNGTNSAASLDHDETSHACFPRRYHAAVERTAHAAPYAPSLRRVRAVRFFFRELKSRHPCSNARAGYSIWMIEGEFSRDEKQASPSSVHRDVGACLPRTCQRLPRPCGGKSAHPKGECHERTSDDDFGKRGACRQPACHWRTSPRRRRRRRTRWWWWRRPHGRLWWRSHGRLWRRAHGWLRRRPLWR